MSGPNQHHIPRSLQRGFLFDVKAEKTYVHRRDGASFPSNIRNVASQRYFYSRPSRDGGKTLDHVITDYEARLDRLLTKLRASPIGSKVEADVAAEVIAHLTPRTASTRRIFGTGAEQFMTAAAKVFSDGDAVMQMLGLAEPEPNEIWNGHISQVLNNEPQLKAMLNLLPISKELFERMIFVAAKEHFIRSHDARNPGIMEMFNSLLHRMDDMVRDGHNRALSHGLVAEPRKAALTLLEWHIRAAAPEGAVLPDCVALGVDEQEGTFLPYMMADMATVSAVVLPLTSEKLLVGVRPGHTTPNLIDFNDDAAACSDELFITASRAPIFAELGKRIGNRWMSKIDTVIHGVLQELLPHKDPPGEGDELPALPGDFQLTFSGFGTEDEIALLSEETQRLIAQIQPLFNLSHFDGITFASAFQEAVDSLERGFDVNMTPEGTPDYIASGAASVLVVRNGVAKVRVILHAAYGASLMGDEPQDAEVALHFLVAGLAQACTLIRFESRFPGFLLKPVMSNDHDGVLHCSVRKALRAYRYAHDSAEFGASELVEQEFTKYFIIAFDSAFAAIAKAKEEHTASPDSQKLFQAVFGPTSDMLTSAARLIGHWHGLRKATFPTADTTVCAALESRQLAGWIEVFSKDLQRFWQKATWEHSDLYALNIHLERVLWTNGIVLSREPNGQGTMIMLIRQQPPQPAAPSKS